MAARFPHFRIHQDRRIDAAHVVAILHEHAPPELLDIILELDAQRAVVPGAGEAAVDLGAGIDEAAPLAQGDYLFHQVFGHILRV